MEQARETLQQAVDNSWKFAASEADFDELANKINILDALSAIDKQSICLDGGA